MPKRLLAFGAASEPSDDGERSRELPLSQPCLRSSARKGRLVAWCLRQRICPWAATAWQSGALERGRRARLESAAAEKLLHQANCIAQLVRDAVESEAPSPCSHGDARC